MQYTTFQMVTKTDTIEGFIELRFKIVISTC